MLQELQLNLPTVGSPSAVFKPLFNCKMLQIPCAGQSNCLQISAGPHTQSVRGQRHKKQSLFVQYKARSSVGTGKNCVHRARSCPVNLGRNLYSTCLQLCQATLTKVHLRKKGALCGRSCACLRTIQHNGAPCSQYNTGSARHKAQNTQPGHANAGVPREKKKGRAEGERGGGCAAAYACEQHNHTGAGFAHHANQKSTTRPHQMPVRLPRVSRPQQTLACQKYLGKKNSMAH